MERRFGRTVFLACLIAARRNGLSRIAVMELDSLSLHISQSLSEKPAPPVGAETARLVERLSSRRIGAGLELQSGGETFAAFSRARRRDMAALL